METMRITSPTTPRRPGARSRFGLALPGLGVCALVLAGCGGEMAQQPAEETSSAAQPEQQSASPDPSASETASSEAARSEDSGAAGEASSTPSGSASEPSAGAGAAVGIPSDRAELEEVLGAAEATLDGSRAVEIDDDRGGWDVTVADGTTEQEVRVGEDLSAQVGESERDDDYDIDPASLEIGLADAVERALAEQDGTVTDVSLDEDDGRGIWEVELDEETDVDVDASSGDILGVER